MTYQRIFAPLAATLAVTALAACGGGGSTASPSLPAGTGGTTPVAAPTAAATPAPVVPAAAPPLVTAQLLGAPGFINKNSRTVYVFDADVSAGGTSTCNGQCATVWPAVTVPANAVVPAPFGIITRADGTSQLTYAGRPLYTYIADSAAGSTAGDGITSFGAVWHIARPQAGAATPAPQPSGTPSSLY